MASLGALFLMAWAWGAQAEWQKGFLEIRPGVKLYVEHREAARGKPTIYLANGLTWSTGDWQPFVRAMDELDPGLGFVLYDPQGMGKTLMKYAPIRERIPFESQITDLKDLRRTLNVKGRTVLAGLSYGGAITIAYLNKYPRDFDVGIAMAPFIERLNDQDQILDTWISTHRVLYPGDYRSYEELYDHYLRVLITSTYPLAEPVLMENPYKLDATFRMVQGAKDFKAVDHLARIPKNKFHLMGALGDDFVKEPRLALFWQAAKEKAGSYLRLKSTKHKIPSERPTVAAAWVMQVINGNPLLQEGAVFEGDPFTKKATDGEHVIELQKGQGCESLL